MPLAPDCEITVEGRILNFDDERIDACLEAGANRFSIGIQTFDTRVRQRMGRRASREEVRTAHFSDRYEIRRDGELVFADATRLTGDVAGHLDERFIAGGARAFASVVYVAYDAESFLAPLKKLMPERGGISLIRPGVLFARLLAPDGYLLRRSLVPVIERLQDAPIPRTWTI